MKPNFYSVLTAAMKDLAEHGFDSEERLARWVRLLREAAVASMLPEHRMREELTKALTTTFRRLVEKGQILKAHPKINAFTLQRVEPMLRAELNRYIAASANLIRLNRAERVEATLRRFQGWGMSVPVGGSSEGISGDRTRVRKALASLPFEERRVLIDQGHKLSSSISAVLATQGRAIAARWRSHWRQAGYDYREDHKDRDGHVYAIRGCWAIERGLMKPGPAGYSDKITQPAEEPFCRCGFEYVYSLSDLPGYMLTVAGRELLANAGRKEMTA